MKINERYVPKNHANRPGDKLDDVLAFILHYTANDSPTATDTNNAKYISRPYKKINGIVYEVDGKTKFRYGSAHTFCDQDSVTRTIPYTEPSYGCGDRQLPYNNGYKGQTKLAHETFKHRQNYRTINIEICNNGDWEKSCNNAIEEIVWVINTYKYPAVFLRHYDITGKICPKPLIDEKKWNEFKNKIYAKLQPKKIKGVKKVTEEVKQILRSAGTIVEHLADGEPIEEQVNWLIKNYNIYKKNGGK